MKDRSSDLVRNVLGVLFVGAMIAASLWILRPFLPALIWATLLVVATWPLMLAVQQRLLGRRGLAVVVMTAALLLVVIIPVALVVTTRRQCGRPRREIACPVAVKRARPAPLGRQSAAGRQQDRG